MADGVDEANELPFVGSEGAVARSNRPAEVGDGMLVLDEHRPETVCRRVALDDERLGEVGQRQYWRGCHRGLEGRERRGGLLGPDEALLQERGERRRDRAIVVDEFAVVAREAQEPTQCTRRAGLGPVEDRLHLCRIHGYAGVGDDVAEVGDGGDAERALGSLDDEAVVAQDGENDAEVAKVIRP